MKMVSTMEMAVFLHSKALTKRDELFVREIHSKGMRGEITSISDDDIIRLDDLYQQYQEKR